MGKSGFCNTYEQEKKYRFVIEVCAVCWNLSFGAAVDGSRIYMLTKQTESSMSAVVEVIDLTTSPNNSVIVIDDESNEAPIPMSTNDLASENPVSKKKRRRRPKAKAKEQAPNGEPNTNTIPNNPDLNDDQNSPPRGQKRKRNEKETLSSQHKPVTSSLSDLPFAIDTAGQPHSEDGLLLPSHVSVTSVASILGGDNQDATEGDRLPSPVSDASGIEFCDDALAVVCVILSYLIDSVYLYTRFLGRTTVFSRCYPQNV